MADTTTVSPAPKRRRRWLRALAWIFVLFILLLVVVYFVGTSSAFVKGVVLPRVSKSLNAEVSASDVAISPFKEVIVRNLKVQPQGQEPLLTVPELHARYSLLDIIRGNIHLDEVTVSGPTIVMVENPDGTSSLDALTKSQKEKPAEKKPEQPAKPSKPPQIDLKKFALTDATIRQVKVHTNGNRDVIELSHVNITLDDLKNGQTGKLALSADTRVENNPPSGTNGLLKAKLSSNFTFSLSPDLKPGTVKGNTHLEVIEAKGAMAELAALAGDLDCDASPTEIKEVALRFQRANSRLGELFISGPFDMSKSEGHLTVQIRSIDKQVLNLAGAAAGADFGTTTINSTNDLVISKLGSLFALKGQLSVAKLQVIRGKQTTPTLDLLARYDDTVDLTAGTSLLREFSLTGAENGNPFLRAALTSPMSLAWGKAASTVGDSTLNLTVSGLNLADWKPFLGDNAPGGIVGVKAKLLSQQGGKALTFDLSTQIENLSAAVGSNQIVQATLTLQANGAATDFKQFKLTEYKLQLAQQKEPVLSITGSGMYDIATTNADMQVTLQTALPGLLKVLPQPDVDISAGTVELKAHVKQQQDAQTVTGTFALNDLTGRVGKNDFRGFTTEIDLDIAQTPQQVELRRVQGKLAEGGKAGGHFDVSGTCNPVKKSAQLTLKLSDFNQDGLRPFLEPLLADKKLVSVALNGTATTQYNPDGDSAIKADLQLSNLVVSDPKNQLPATPLEAKMQCDTSVNKKVADIRLFQIALTPTKRAKNEVQLKGHVDASQTNAITGDLKLAADSLDLTSYYDLFAKPAQPAAAEKKPAPTKAAPAVSSTPPSPEKEPDAMQLPLRNFTADVAIGRIYLREVEITNFHTATKIDGGHVVLNPFQLALNGAPVNASADLDLGVPGYKYDVGFNAQTIPLAPLVDSFAPERAGQVHGTLTAQAKIAGAGTTGASLQKHLTGQFDVNSTNLNLSVVNVKSAVLKTLINVVGSIPELLRNPESALGSLFGGGGLTEDLKRSPIDAIIARGTAGNGRVDLQQAVVQSPAFRADATGTIMLADVLTNSTINIPVSISLSQPIAQRLGMASAEGPTNAAYSKLPDFFTEKGTVGVPKSDINKLALLGLAAKSVGGAVPALGGKAGNVLQGIGGLLSGEKQGATNANTNQPAANQPPAFNPLDLFKKPKK